MIDNAESVVRILFPNKILHGKVMGGAFALQHRLAMIAQNGLTHVNTLLQ